MSRWRSLKRLIEALLQEDEPVARPAGPVVPEAMSRPAAAAAAEVSAAREALRTGDADGAADAAETALSLAPKEICAIYYLGQALIRKQRFDDARQLLADAKAHDDPFGLVSMWLDRVEQMVADGGDWPGPLISRAIELERSARAALRQGNHEAAEQLARDALEADPENLLARHHLGQSLVAQGRRDEALKEFEVARDHGAGLGLIDAWIVNALAPEPADEDE